MMEIRVNGEPRQLPEGTTVARLVELAGPAAGPCAVALNLDFVPRAAYAQTVLHAGDQVEIVTPRQGG
jgi:sulfur carrier protein